MRLMMQSSISLPLSPGKKVYFASDFHLGAPDMQASLERERLIVQWLNHIEPEAAHIFLVGDIFDFWFEYKKVIPKGYTRLLGKLADLSDKGIGLSVFTGNHDMWMDGYFEKELCIPVYTNPQVFRIGGKEFYIGHGDGLGPGDRGYKMLKKVFRNKCCRGLFSLLHPSWGIALADYFSRRSRAATQLETFLGEEHEWLVLYAREKLRERHFDYFIFGHRHLPLDITLKEDSRYVNLGDWLHYDSYAVFDGEQLALHTWHPSGRQVLQTVTHPISHEE